MGAPRQQQNMRSALTLLALLDLKEDENWSHSTKVHLTTYEIMSFMRENYGQDYAANTRETIRRQTLHQFIQANIVIKNEDSPERPTNSPKTNYAITDEALSVITEFQTPDWTSSVYKFTQNYGKLRDKYNKINEKTQIHFVEAGEEFLLTPGKHNMLQAQVITELKQIFFSRAVLAYLGDTSNKLLYLNEEIFSKNNIQLNQHDKLPDIVFWDEYYDSFILIEVVTSHGPVSPKRLIELEKVFSKSRRKRIYLSAFPDYREFKRHLDNIAWDTEVWIYENPTHLIHFNGPKFFSIYNT